MSTRRLAAALACVVLVGVLGACSRTAAEQTSGGYVTGNGAITYVDPDEREPAPDLAGPGLDGEQLDVASYAGQTVVVNTWGSWCPPCRQEAPALAEVSRAYADRDVQFLGIVVRDQVSTAKAFSDRVGKPYPSIFDPSSQTLLGFADSLPSVAIPTTWVIDDQGRVAARVLDEVSASTLSALIDDVQSGKVRQGDE